MNVVLDCQIYVFLLFLFLIMTFFFFFFFQAEDGIRDTSVTGVQTCALPTLQGLYEVMALTSPLRREILKGASTEELRDLAVKEGMLTLRMDGMVKVKKGITTLEEVVKETAAG